MPLLITPDQVFLGIWRSARAIGALVGGALGPAVMRRVAQTGPAVSGLGLAVWIFIHR